MANPVPQPGRGDPTTNQTATLSGLFKPLGCCCGGRPTNDVEKGETADYKSMTSSKDSNGSSMISWSARVSTYNINDDPCKEA